MPLIPGPLARALPAAAALGLAFGATPSAATDWRDLCAAPADLRALAACEGAVLAVPEDEAALRRLAWLLLSNNREPRALELFGRLAMIRHADPEAQFDYAAALATVWNYQAAAEPITRAIRLRGDEPRYYRLAAVIYEQLARPDEAFVFHLRLARMGDRIAMFDLAWDYDSGRGTAPDAAAAQHWYEKAAAEEHVGAMEQLAEAYRSGGLGLERNPERADYWLGRADELRGGPALDP